ncbi:GNAT family N-acetyltransferase [Romboutsia lituseburensis]|uniref:GNAT family N-acetyltransferase n=1 Tax=Romboutsia lituseburensis TaxID=1537 RepID=UPI00215A37A3|nr:GNAT family N-acetyltransferase [Romboutsia lituseburensis]MCR8745168.1 GNAT family N-acetyltransferase [Romboutsia lituseburensis]
MIVKLDSSHHNDLMKYLNKEPEFNLLIIGDIERYGYDNYFFNIWGNVNKDGNIEGVLVKYFEFLTFYSYDTFDVSKFAKFINRLNYSEISGKTWCIDELEGKLNLSKKRTVNFCKLENMNNLDENRSEIKIKKIRFGNINKVAKLYESIEEFDVTSVENIKSGLKSGRGYCVEINRKVVAMAKSTSENHTHAMIVGVGTHPNYRNNGYATKCIVKICKELLSENKIPCLFYDNQQAGKIYKKIGFKELGKWTICYR